MAPEDIGHYRLESKLGAGGMGVVYLARDLQLKRRVAIKLLHGPAAKEESARKRLLQEAQTASALNHPNICTIYEAGESGGQSYIAMEHVEGRTLSEALKDGPLPHSMVLRFGIQIADALAHAHERGFVHRDLKCGNVMITPENRVKLLDFGLACRTAEAALEEMTHSDLSESDQRATAGTIQYMAPEALQGEAVGPAADVWALGVVLYQTLTGRFPFNGRTVYELTSAILKDTPAPLPQSIPSGLRGVIERCLEKNPSERYTHVATVREVLESPMPQTEHRIRWALLPLSVLLVAAVIGGLWMSLRPKAQPEPAKATSLSSPAHDLYVRGSYYVSHENRADNEMAIQLLEQAVARDPGFTPAYAQLARAYVVHAFYVEPGVKAWEEKSYVAIQKALELNPASGEAHFARGLYLWTPAQHFLHADAIREYRRAIALSPELDEAHHQLGLVYAHVGLLEDAERELERAVALNPANTLARLRLGVPLLYQGNYERALAALQKGSSDYNPSIVVYQTAWSMFEMGRADESRRSVADFLREHPEDKGGLLTSANAALLAAAGENQSAEEAIAQAVTVGKGFGHFHHAAYNIACAYALMGNRQKAVTWLRNAAGDGFPNYPLFAREPFFKSLKDDPQFVALITELRNQMEEYRAIADAPLKL